ncbi:MAG: hypothetical protein OHK0039_45340 [Bacteroidia bacterium]
MEAEWGYAAGGGANDRTKWAGTSDGKALGDYAWYNANRGGKTHPVDEKKPNALGLYDMSGNVWEWCQDHWHDSYKGAPADGSAWEDRGDDAFRVARGGSWGDGPVGARVSSRVWHTIARLSGLGFRLARTF